MANEFFAQKRSRGDGVTTVYENDRTNFLSYIYITNVCDENVHFSIYVAPRGEKYSKDTAMIYREELYTEDTDIMGYFIPIFNGTRIGVWCSVSGGVNVTVFGGSGIAGLV